MDDRMALVIGKSLVMAGSKPFHELMSAKIWDAIMMTVLLKYGRWVAKCDPWIYQATQGSTIDGPFGYQWILQVLLKMFCNESGEAIPQMYWYQMFSVP